MGNGRGFTYGLAFGAALMFLLDPRRGAARRAFIREKSRRTVHEIEDAYGIGKRDLSHRVEGAIARALSSRDEKPIAGDVLVARVRAALGRVCAHTHAIHVADKGGGIVELTGPVLAAEHERVVSEASHVKGVAAIDDDLDVHANADQAGLAGPCSHPRPLAHMWTPAVRLVVGFAAAGVAVASLLRGHPVGFVAGGATVLGLARSIARRTVPGQRRRTHGTSEHVDVSGPREHVEAAASAQG